MEPTNHDFACPWCMSRNQAGIDPGDMGQEVIQDCRVCCRPIVLVCRESADGSPELDARREED